MSPREDAYYQAMLARDPRFDGKFFVGVRTTGIYCRPICPARPKRENVEFFASALGAERAGYRPCLRCRPESAPRSPAWIGSSAVVRRAARALQSGTEPGLQGPNGLDEDAFAARFGVSARHLRRLFVAEIGKTPAQLAAEARLNLARQLLTESRLPITEIAFAAGFGSVRRFNDAFKARFAQSPSQIRRQRLPEGAPLALTLAYRPPFDFESLYRIYESHRVGELERFEGGRMHRVYERGGQVGTVAISHEPERHRLRVEIDFPDLAAIPDIVARVRALFDLDSDPVLVANALELDPGVAGLLRRRPGIRLPSGWDPFETAVAAILGQLVSVERGRALVAQLIEIAGRPSGMKTPEGREIRLFPSPEQLARADLAGLGSTGARKRALRELARRVASGELSLDPAQDVDAFVAQALAIPGVGPWTASYLALRVLRHTDAFPATDLILARALERHPVEAVARMSPWRGYVAALFWREYAETLKKKPKARRKR